MWRYGDLDGDNYVSQAEVDYIRANVGYTLQPHDDLKYNFRQPYQIIDADLNGDGKITQVDLDLAEANLGQHGD